MSRPPRGEGARVWDLPTRLFHWTLTALVILSVATAKVGGLWMDWHMRSGYAILALVVFRLLWGFAGSETARFAAFVRRPRAIVDYLRGRDAAKPGHNPLGAWSVLALLGVLLVQGTAGLFTNDGSFTEGPLARLIGGDAGERLSTLHRYGEWAVFAVVGLHLAAITYYSVIRREPLVRAMVTGRQPTLEGAGIDDGALLRLRALLLAGVAAGLVTYVVTL